MFKSIKDFDSAMRDILVKIRNGEDYGELSSKLGEENFREALGKCVEFKFIIGMTANRNKDGEYIIETLTPIKISYEGLRYVGTFLES